MLLLVAPLGLAQGQTPFSQKGPGRMPPPAAPTVPDGGTNYRLPPKHYTSKSHFHLPIRIADGSRAQLREVVLYLKKGRGPWIKQATTDPTKKHFTYRAPSDGEYWFSVTTVDLKGRSNPPDVSKEPPALIVVVDTQPPVVEVSAVKLPNGENALRCFVKDANPDYESLELACLGTDGKWHDLSKIPRMPGTFAFPTSPVNDNTFRYTAKDRTPDNKVSEVVHVQLPSQRHVAKKSVSAEMPELPPTAERTPGGDFPPSGNDPQIVPPPRPPIRQASNTDTMKAKSGGYAATKQNTQETQIGITPPPRTLPEEVSNPTGSPTQTRQKVDNRQPPYFPDQPPRTDTNTKDSMGNSRTAYRPSQEVPNRQLINTRQATVDYRIDQVGPSGICKVDVWVKSDQAGRWQLRATDVDHRSPVGVNLPGEGLYGIHLSVTNGHGLGGQAPSTKTNPDFWIEVDTTSPYARVENVAAGTKGATIEIDWTASDKNLGAKPISLYYSTTRGGPWLPIAQQIENEKHYTWRFPQNVGSQFYFRLEVRDEAGNVTRAETPSPLTLDLTQPKALVVGVRGSGPIGGQ